MYLEDFINQILSIPKFDKKIDSAFLERLNISKIIRRDFGKRQIFTESFLFK